MERETIEKYFQDVIVKTFSDEDIIRFDYILDKIETEEREQDSLVFLRELLYNTYEEVIEKNVNNKATRMTKKVESVIEDLKLTKKDVKNKEDKIKLSLNIWNE